MLQRAKSILLCFIWLVGGDFYFKKIKCKKNKMENLMLLMLHKALKGSRNIQGFALIRAVLFLSKEKPNLIWFIKRLFFDTTHVHKFSQIITSFWKWTMLSLNTYLLSQFHEKQCMRSSIYIWKTAWTSFKQTQMTTKLTPHPTEAV